MEILTTSVIGAVCTLAGFAFAFAAYRRGLREDARRDGTILAEIGYLKSGVDYIRRDLRENDRRYVDTVARLNTVEAKLNAQTSKEVQ